MGKHLQLSEKLWKPQKIPPWMFCNIYGMHPLLYSLLYQLITGCHVIIFQEIVMWLSILGMKEVEVMNTFVVLTPLTGLHQEHNILMLNFILVLYPTISH